VGDQIVIQASDDFGALGVNVALTDGAGSPLALRQAQDASRKAVRRSKRLPIAAAGSTAPPAQSPPARPYASPSLPATAPAARAKPHKRRLSKKIGLWRKAIPMPVLGLPCAILDYTAELTQFTTKRDQPQCGKTMSVNPRLPVPRSWWASVRVRHGKKNEKKSTRKAFEKAWRCVDTRGEQAQHISEGQPKNASPQAQRDCGRVGAQNL